MNVERMTLHEAIQIHTHEEDLIRSLFRCPKAAEAKDSNGNFPLYYATKRYHQIQRFFIALAKTYPDAILQDWKDGENNALHALCMLRETKMVVQLLSRNPNIINHFDQRKQTILHLASLHGDKTLVCSLLQYSNIAINQRDRDKATALHYSDWKIIPYFLQYNGINVRIIDSMGDTSFMKYLKVLDREKVKYTNHSRKFKILKMFLDKDPGLVSCFRSHVKSTILHRIVYYDNVDIFQAVMPYASHLQASLDVRGQTPLQKAAAEKRFKSLNYLLCCPLINVNQVGGNGGTVLHLACQEHDAAMIETLLKCPRMSYAAIDNYGDTPLHTTIRTLFRLDQNHLEDHVLVAISIINLFLNIHKCLVYVKNNNNQTMLDIIRRKYMITKERNDKLMTNHLKKLKNVFKNYEWNARWTLFNFLRNSTIENRIS
jgi:Ankyrin repeats (3 copies)